ncbi:MAG: FGGY-family carbohydrate kinase, partial [Myxococcota bacterium]|nr:FGGY-family carbohydrate kinase [Myxococcota bacterium]
ALEGIAYQVNDLLGAMGEDSGKSIEVLRVDGGATANNFLMQFQSDLLGISLHRPEVLDTTALGAAYLAALGVGIFSDLSEVTRAWALEREFTSEVSREVVADQVTQWRAAVERA